MCLGGEAQSVGGLCPCSVTPSVLLAERLANLKAVQLGRKRHGTSWPLPLLSCIAAILRCNPCRQAPFPLTAFLQELAPLRCIAVEIRGSTVFRSFRHQHRWRVTVAAHQTVRRFGISAAACILEAIALDPSLASAVSANVVVIVFAPLVILVAGP